MMIQKILCAVACAAGLAFGASAGIPEFNDAMRRGDIQAASVEAVDTWESWDKTHPDTALMAREFGFVSMLAGNYEAARDFARFLADQGAHLPKPDDFPLTSAVLLWAAEYKLSGSAEMRDALAVSLRQRAEIEGVDLITAAGAEALYSGDWVTGDWERLIESAGLAVELMALGKPVLAYIRDEDLHFIDPRMRAELPVLQVTPDTVAVALRSILEMPRQELGRLGKRSRAFIERWHDPMRIAADIKRDYEAAIARKDAKAV